MAVMKKEDVMATSGGKDVLEFSPGDQKGIVTGVKGIIRNLLLTLKQKRELKNSWKRPNDSIMISLLLLQGIISTASPHKLQLNYSMISGKKNSFLLLKLKLSHVIFVL